MLLLTSILVSITSSGHRGKEVRGEKGLKGNGIVDNEEIKEDGGGGGGYVAVW